MSKQAVVLVSGGIDSTVVATSAIKVYGRENVHALSFSYGQKHDKELENAIRVTSFLGIKHKILEVDQQLFAASDSTLLKGGGDIAHRSYADTLKEFGEGTVDTYVPFRNGLMLAQAAAYAYSVGKEDTAVVLYGAHADDAAGSAYPDCTPEFYNATRESIERGTGGIVTMQAPLIDMNKSEVVSWGLGLGAPLHFTRSCYEEDDTQCGECGTCIDRIKAFKDNGIIDPAPYKINIDWIGCEPYMTPAQSNSVLIENKKQIQAMIDAQLERINKYTETASESLSDVVRELQADAERTGHVVVFSGDSNPLSEEELIEAAKEEFRAEAQPTSPEVEEIRRLLAQERVILEYKLEEAKRKLGLS